MPRSGSTGRTTKTAPQPVATTAVATLRHRETDSRDHATPAIRRAQVRKDVREFIRRLEAVGLTVEATPGHYRVLRDGKPLRKANGMPFMLPFSPDTIRWRRSAIIELRKLGISV
jgi:hypothetical protein